MQVETAANTAGTAAPTTTTATGTTQRPKDKEFDYLKLIVAQMRNMNPMDPSSGGDSLPLMMQAESLSQLTKLNTSIAELQVLNQTGYASSLIGRTVTGMDETGAPVSGAVSGLRVDAGGPVLQLDSGRRLRLLDITEVSSS